MINGWMPHLRRDGLVASGLGEIFLWEWNGEEPVNVRNIAKGLRPRWKTDDTLVVKLWDDLPYTMTVDGATKPISGIGPFVLHDAGGGKVLYTGGDTIWVSVGRDGTRTQVVEHGGNNRDHSLIVNGDLIERGILNYGNSDQGYTVWSRFEPREIWGQRPGGRPEKLCDGLFAMPVIGNGQAWVMVQTHTGIILFPWGEPQGYKIETGEDNNFHPDALFLTSGNLAVVWNKHDGQPGRKDFTLAEPRINVFSATTQPPPVVQPPPITPEPRPPVLQMTLTQRAKDIIIDLYNRNRSLAHGNDDQRRELTKKIAEQMRLEFGSEWGWKSAHSNLASPSKDAIACVPGGGKHGERQTMFVFDMFNGATREPHADPHGEETSQWFIEVAPVNHLGSVYTPPTTPLPPPTVPGKDEVISTLSRAVLELQKTIEAQGEAIKLLREKLSKNSDRIDLILARPTNHAEYEIVSDADGKPFTTGRSFSHSHSINLRIRRKQ